MKTGRINLRLETHLFAALSLISERDHRSINNMIELLIIKECEFREIDIESLKGEVNA
jgi:hypothetical protein